MAYTLSERSGDNRGMTQTVRIAQTTYPLAAEGKSPAKSHHFCFQGPTDDKTMIVAVYISPRTEQATAYLVERLTPTVNHSDPSHVCTDTLRYGYCDKG